MTVRGFDVEHALDAVFVLVCERRGASGVDVGFRSVR
jgi:hypothetical protein